MTNGVDLRYMIDDFILRYPEIGENNRNWYVIFSQSKAGDLIIVYVKKKTQEDFLS